MNVAAVILSVLGIYLVFGLIFAIPFVLVGAKRIDPHATTGTWGFRLLIIPGATLLWPLLLRRWMSRVHAPPTEHNAHRCASQAYCSKETQPQ